MSTTPEPTAPATDAPAPGVSADDASEDGDARLLAELEERVDAWLSVPEAADRQGVPLRAVRTQLKERLLLGVRRGPNRALYVPAVFVTHEGPRPELRGTFTVLADGGMSDLEILAWLFAPDDTLPVPGNAMDSLMAGHKTEIRRRAMEIAF